jgi:hypothetical protein
LRHHGHVEDGAAGASAGVGAKRGPGRERGPGRGDRRGRARERARGGPTSPKEAGPRRRSYFVTRTSVPMTWFMSATSRPGIAST